MLRKAVPTAVPARQDTTVVDVGCGSSALLRDMRRDGWGGKLVGVDVSQQAVLAARKRAASEKVDVEYVVGSAESLVDALRPAGVAEGSVDLVVDKALMDSLLHDERSGEQRVAKMLEEVARLLKPTGGAFVCITQMDPRVPDDAAFLRDVVLARGLLRNPVPASQQRCTWDVHAHVSSESVRTPGIIVCRKRASHGMSLRHTSSRAGADSDSDSNDNADGGDDDDGGAPGADADDADDADGRAAAVVVSISEY